MGFWGGMALAAILVGLLGGAVRDPATRRIYRAPELFQLLATFGATLVVQDFVLLIWGPEDLLAPRAPGLAGAVEVLGKRVPSYDLFLIVLGPVVLALLWLLLHRTRWGVLVRAATQDRDMVAALGVNQKWLFTGVFALGTFLAGLGGALEAPREAADHTMDLRIIVEIFVVVVIGGLGSIEGAFVAAILVSLLNAFGILILPKISLVLVFLLMAVVLVIRPWGLFGKKEGAARISGGAIASVWKPLDRDGRLVALMLVAAAALRAACAWPLRSRGRDRDRDLRAVRREPAPARLGRRPRLVRPRRVPRSRLLRRRARGKGARPADAAGACRRPSARGAGRRGDRMVRRVALGCLRRDADARLRPDPLVDRLSMGVRSPAATTACLGSGPRPGRRPPPICIG